MRDLLLLLPLVGCSPTGSAVPLTPVPDHPHLARSTWPTAHATPYAQGSVSGPGLADADAYDVAFVPVGLPSITLAITSPYPDGSVVAWGSSALKVYKLLLGDELSVVAELNDGAGLQDLVAGAYTLVDEAGTFFATGSTSLRAFRDADPADPRSGIERAGSLDLTRDDGGTLRGLGLTWDGVLVAASSTGRVFAVSRSLELLSEVVLDGEVSNSHAIDERGGIYIVTSEAMHRVQWTGAALSLDPADGAWVAAYEAGSADLVGGRLGAGSGSTPSLMNAGDDHLVLITDAQPLMHLVAFWRDAIPAGWEAPEGADPRVAGIAPVTFGDPTRQTSVSEQSVLVLGHGAVVVNNDYGELEGMEPVLRGLAAPGIEKFSWDPSARELRSTWALPNIACPNGIPSASASDGRMYCIGRREQLWTVEAVDWELGEPAFHVPLGTESRWNSAYAATEIGPGGDLLSGTLEGAVRVRALP